MFGKSGRIYSDIRDPSATKQVTAQSSLVHLFQSTRLVVTKTVVLNVRPVTC